MSRLELNSNGIVLGDHDQIPWAEICALHAAEVDTMISSITILQLEHESGHYLEIDEQHDSYEHALSCLGTYLPLEDEWTKALKGMEPAATTTIWRRTDSK